MEKLSRTAQIARQLIRFDTTNFGEGKSRGEAQAAEYVIGILESLGLQARAYESAPGRVSVVSKISGLDPGAGGLVVHGHLDVVPARAEDWSVDPFAGEIKDGYLWGRGAVDMKDMVAMMLSVVEGIVKSDSKPYRDLTLVFFADEEAGGEYGSHFMVDEHPEVFAGATEAISEVGGYSVYLAGRRFYMLQLGEKGITWLRLRATGTAGHGSLVNRDSAVVKLVRALERIVSHDWPIEITVTTRAFLGEVMDLADPGLAARMAGLTEGRVADPDLARDLAEFVESLSGFLPATLQNTANPTLLEAGYKQNVIPGLALALVDARPLPGQERYLLDKLRELAGRDVEVEIVREDVSFENDLDSPIVDDMLAALRRFDPDARPLPYLLSGGTDNKALSRLGIRGYGFAPLLLPPELNFSALFHGVDERVPLSALDFGHDVLESFLLNGPKREC